LTRLGEDRFHAEITDGSLSLTAGPPPSNAEANALAAVAYGCRKFADAIRAWDVGGIGGGAKVFGLFPLPKG